MIKSKSKDVAFSFIMGVDESFLEKLNSFNATYDLESGKYYLVSIPKINLSEYEQIISEYLKPGFWNEYISDKVVFIFKNTKGNIIRYEWNPSNEKEILKLCNEYANLNTTSIEEMLLGEPFYKENTIKY